MPAYPTQGRVRSKMERAENLSIATWPSRGARNQTRVSAKAFAAILVGSACLSAALSSWLPLQMSIVTVFLFAGPHNWFELRYFLMRLLKMAQLEPVVRAGKQKDCDDRQLVRAALFPDASAGEVRPLAEFLCRGLRRYFLSHPRLCFSSRALLHKSLVGGELANGNCHVEHVHVVVDWCADYFARQTELPGRLVLGGPDHLYALRFELVKA